MIKAKESTNNTPKPKPTPKGKRKPIGPATQAWMVQERLFRDMVATF